MTKIFENTPQLKLANLTVGQLVATKGYTVAGDEGQQEYLIQDPQVVDEVNSFTLPNGNVAKLQRTNASSIVDVVISFTGGGALVASRINELQDGDTYLLPLAASTQVNEQITIDLPSTFGAFTPLVQADGGDNITNIDGSDTEILFEGPTEIKLTSDGVATWRL